MNKSDLMVFPLGGVEEIGSNCTVYLYNNHAIIIDYGISMHSLDDLTPYNASYIDINKFLSKFENKIQTISLVITHCHDDHIGGLKLFKKDLLSKEFEKLNITIYVCHEFNKVVINNKHEGINYDIVVIPYEEEYKICENFSFKYYEVDHSIPYAAGVYVKAGELRLFHTGDWRFDSNVCAINSTKEIISKASQIKSKSLETFVKLRNDCDIVISESTNMAKVSPYCNEEMVAKEIEDIFKTILKKDKEILFTCFASNVRRLQTVIKIAMKLDFKIGCLGRSIHVFLNSAVSTGVLTNEEFAYVKFYTNLDSLIKGEAQIKIITGCQNEQNSILNRLAYGNRKCLSGKQIIIFSANIIPTIRKRVESLYKQLERMNVHVLTTDINKLIHSSGHATRKEIILMYNIINPKAVIPIHGNVVTIREHAKVVSKNFKMPNLKPKYLRYFTFDAKDNKKLNYNVLNIPDKYMSEKRMLDYRLYEQHDSVFQERKKLIQNGVIVVNVDKKIVTTVGTRISKVNTDDIINICIKNKSINEEDSEKHMMKIKQQIVKLMFNFTGEIIVN